MAFESREERGRARGVVRHEGGLITCHVVGLLLHVDPVAGLRAMPSHWCMGATSCRPEFIMAISAFRRASEGWPAAVGGVASRLAPRTCRKWRRLSKKPAEADADALIHRLSDVLVQAQVRRAPARATSAS